MKVIFQTVPIPATALLPDGKAARGVLSFQAKIYEPEEFRKAWPKSTSLEPASQWLRQVDPAGNIVITPSKRHHPDAPPVVIPAGVLRAVPGDALVAMEFWWEPAK